MERLYDDPAFAYVWCAATLIGFVAMFVGADVRVFITIWMAGGLVAAAVADVRKQRTRSRAERERRLDVPGV